MLPLNTAPQVDSTGFASKLSLITTLGSTTGFRSCPPPRLHEYAVAAAGSATEAMTRTPFSLHPHPYLPWRAGTSTTCSSFATPSSVAQTEASRSCRVAVQPAPRGGRLHPHLLARHQLPRRPAVARTGRERGLPSLHTIPSSFATPFLRKENARTQTHDLTMFIHAQRAAPNINRTVAAVWHTNRLYQEMDLVPRGSPLAPRGYSLGGHRGPINLLGEYGLR